MVGERIKNRNKPRIISSSERGRSTSIFCSLFLFRIFCSLFLFRSFAAFSDEVNVTLGPLYVSLDVRKEPRSI